MKTTALKYSLLALGVAAALGACSNNNSNSGPYAPCALPSGVSVSLVYPAPNSTGIPDAVGLVVLGSTSALPSSYGTTLVNQSTGIFVNFGQFTSPPNPLPSPAATPAFLNPVYQASNNLNGVTFVAGSTIGVYVNNPNSSCNPTGPIGQFVVQ